MVLNLQNASLKDRLLYYFGRRRAFRVEGDSMVPTLKNGDVVLIDERSRVEVGSVVLAHHPYKARTKIVKRVSAIDADGRLVLSGDNPAHSTDSRSFGTVTVESIIGCVVSRLRL